LIARGNNMSTDPRHIQALVEASASDEAPSQRQGQAAGNGWEDSPAASFDEHGGGDPIS